MTEDSIIIVGCGRSGTTLLYEMLCCHPHLGWFSNFIDRWPSLSVLGVWSNMFPISKRRGFRGRIVPVPSEGYRFWNDLCRLESLPFEDPLTDQDVTPKARQHAQRTIDRVLRYQRKRRFVNKSTRNTRRIRYVDALLDRPRFINMIRDPRATVASLIQVPFWPDITVWSEAGITPREWQRLGREPVELAAKLWSSDVEKSLEDQSEVPADRTLQVRYEDLVADPSATLSRVLSFANLPVTPAFMRSLSGTRIVDANMRSVSTLSAGQLAAIVEIAGPTAERLGYEL